MSQPTSLSKHIYDELQLANWPDISIDEQKNFLTCPNGTILQRQGNELTLNFFFYSQEKNEYGDVENYGTLTFPKDFSIRGYLYFRKTGNYSISLAKIFKMIVNPLSKKVKKIKISNTANKIRFFGTTIVIPRDTFMATMADAQRISQIADSYKYSTQNYLANQASQKYSRQFKKGVTYLEKGEFKFIVDRYYLKTKKKKNDYLRFINSEDIESLEELVTHLIRYEVFSTDFIKFLDEYFIKEKLKEIISIGKKIINLKSGKMNTLAVKDVVSLISDKPISQFEGLWQKYFEKYLLYLIFTYKKIFPKVELENIKGG